MIWKVTITVTTTMPNMSYNSGNANDHLKYQGKELDEEGDLYKYHFGWRDYDPELGRWYVVDPARQYASPYVFGGNNPINGYDEDGRFFVIDAWIVGLLDGLINEKNALDEANKRAGHDIEIWGGLFQTDSNRPWYQQAFQVLGRFTWELPQTVAGLGTGLTHNFLGGVESVDYGYGATLIESKSSNWGAFTLGSYIIAQKETEVGDYTFMHEYGHYMQSQLLGPLYLPGIGLPSLYSISVNDRYEHHQFWTEKWADDNALKFFGDKYRPMWEYYHGDSKSNKNKKSNYFNKENTLNLIPYNNFLKNGINKNFKNNEFRMFDMKKHNSIFSKHQKTMKLFENKHFEK